jgi:hypothetical protein
MGRMVVYAQQHENLCIKGPKRAPGAHSPGVHSAHA